MTSPQMIGAGERLRLDDKSGEAIKSQRAMLLADHCQPDQFGTTGPSSLMASARRSTPSNGNPVQEMLSSIFIRSIGSCCSQQHLRTEMAPMPTRLWAHCWTSHGRTWSCGRRGRLPCSRVHASSVQHAAVGTAAQAPRFAKRRPAKVLWSEPPHTWCSAGTAVALSTTN